MLVTYRMEKQFALLLAAVMCGVALWPLLFGGGVVWLWSVAALLPLALAWRAPSLLTPLARGWLWLGHQLGRMNSWVILALLFFLLITPVALLFRLVGRDALRLRQAKQPSYWLRQERRWSPERFKDQF